MSRRHRRHQPPPASPPPEPPTLADSVVEAVAPLTPAPAFPAQAATPAVPLPVGEQLIRARTARDETIGTIAAYLRIKPEYLYAFEQGRHQDMPALTYALGFLRTYADYLGLDGNALRDAFRREMMDKLTPQLTMPQPLPEAKVPSAPLILGAFLAGVMLVAGWSAFLQAQRAAIPPLEPPSLRAVNANNPPSTEPGIPLVTVTESLPSPGAKEQHFGELSKPTRLTIKAEAEVWLTITDKADRLRFSQMMNAGDTYHVPDEPGLKLTTANAEALLLNLDDKPLPKLGKAGQVLRDKPLDTLGKP